MNPFFDTPRITSTAVLPESSTLETKARIQNVFSEFIRDFRFGSDFTYRDTLTQNLLIQQFFLEVDLAHLNTYNEHLSGLLVQRPADYIPLFEGAIKDLARQILNAQDIPDCQIMVISNANAIPLRALDASKISKLVRIPGMIISASSIQAKSTKIHAMCKTCRHVKLFNVNAGFAGIQLPRVCDGPKDQNSESCPVDPYIIVHDKSTFIDQQMIKLQELPDMIPMGELPRHIQMTCDRYLANRVVPGTRVTITGLYTSTGTKLSKTSAIAVRMAYIRVVGMEIDTDGSNRMGKTFTEEEEEEYIQMSRRPNLYNEFCRSIAPGIYGAEDIKRAIACLLMGGSRKVLPDGIRLRGDVNVLLLGDPGIAKSQLLKFVENVAPIAVYTSGKGSSAAGLTASVVRDPSTKEFYLEGGAMVLADGGVVCIDEFDKMREEDRVAIHEAMEQQTISIAKAGITTILNSRTSVLAAANPVFGRYDDMKSPGENIEFQSTILSRFDLIFIVRDEHDEEKDKKIARHVMDIHTNHRQTDLGSSDFDIQKMRGYIGYCRAKCAPRLSASAADKLISHFVEVRGKVKEMRKDISGARNGVPITVRQLEAIIRISESLAKMTLSPVATDRHVDEAIRLFNISTLHAIQSGPGGEGVFTPEYTKQVDMAQAYILRRLPRGNQCSYARLKSDLEAQEFAESVIDRAVYSLTHKQVLEFKDRRLNVCRVG